MSLLFGNATSDRVDLGTDTRLTALADLTVFGWVYPTSLINNRALGRKGTDTNARAWEVTLNGTGGNFQLIANSATGTGPDAQIAVTSDTPFSTTSKWYWVAVVMSWAVSTSIYVGDLNTLAVARTLSGGGQLGNGAQAGDTGGPLIIGNRDNYDRAFPGRIGVFGCVPAILTLNEVRVLQDDPNGLGGPLYWLGEDGASVVKDRSGGGIDGTVTGATVAPFVPIGRRRVTTTALQRAALW
ncbi:MAG: hypothetical protein KJZ47_09625 [Gemmatimonadales bacterium]|nr:hypothetical protein [Gemmatimonadales bacterium]